MTGTGAGSGLYLACLLVLLAGCLRDGSGLMAGAGPVSSRILATSRTVPCSPLAAQEPGRGLADVDAGGRAFGEGAGLSGDEVGREQAVRDIVWLPYGEAATMRRFMRMLQSGKGPSSSLLVRVRMHLPEIVEVFTAHGLPLELALLPLVESRFKPWAVSPSGAAGLWQLMPETANRFGLRVSPDLDERFDVRKSTSAAASYLSFLRQRFRDWPLALAAYNCGEGALSRALERTGSGTLSELSGACRRERRASGLLSRETLAYVPSFVGAVRVMSGIPDVAEWIRPGVLDAGFDPWEQSLRGATLVRSSREGSVGMSGDASRIGASSQ